MTTHSVQGGSTGLSPSAAVGSHARWLTACMDGLLVGLFVALFARFTPPDPTFHAIFALLVVRAFVVDVRVTLLLLGGVTVALVGFLAVGQAEVEVPELFEWLVMISLVGVVAVVAGRRDRAAHHFAGLYHDATENLVMSQEEQRLRLAQDLHDGVGQGIGALLLHLDAVGTRVAGDAETAALVESARDVSSGILDDIRGVVMRLYPAVAHPAGLPGAVRALADHAGLPVELVIDPRILPGMLTQAGETALFRIVQEALANASRHSRGSRVAVTVELVDGVVHAAVADDGAGFTLARAGGRGIGLLAMEQRAARVGGRLVIETAPGRGTVVGVTIPCVPRPQPAAPLPGTVAEHLPAALDS